MTDYKIELTEKISIKDRSIIIIKKIDDYFNKLIRKFLEFIPTWFKLMNWLIMSGAILYVYLRYKSSIFGILFIFSLFCLCSFIILSIKILIKKHLPVINKYSQKYAIIDLFLSIVFIIFTFVVFFGLFYISFGLSLP
jgi:hypothetical protein